MICVAFFFQILPNLHCYLLNSVKRDISHRGTVGSASACQARGNGFEPGLERYIFVANKTGTSKVGAISKAQKAQFSKYAQDVFMKSFENTFETPKVCLSCSI